MHQAQELASGSVLDWLTGLALASKWESVTPVESESELVMALESVVLV